MHPSDKPALTSQAENARGLHRVLSLTEVTAGGVGIIIGAGIYVLIGAATATAGPSVWISFILAAVLCAFTGLSYAELASRFPSAAAEYTYTQQVFPRWVAFITGWVMIFGLIIAAATVALGFANYLGLFAPALGGRSGAALLIVAVAALAMRGIKQSARLTLGLSAIQIGGLLFIIAIGIPHIGTQPLLTTSIGQDGGPSISTGVFGAAALVFFAFIGFDEVATLAEETRDPARTVPRALFLALGISTLLYVGVAIAAVSVLGAPALGASPRPLADVVAHVLGDRSAAAVAAIALVSTTNTSLLALTSASRVIFGMARDTALPRVLADVRTHSGAPVPAIVLAALIALGFVMVGDLKLIAGVADFAVYVVFIAVNATVVVLRLRDGTRAVETFRVRGTIAGVPVLPLLGTGAVLLMLTHLEPKVLWIGALLLGAGAVAAVLRQR